MQDYAKGICNVQDWDSKMPVILGGWDRDWDCGWSYRDLVIVIEIRNGGVGFWLTFLSYRVIFLVDKIIIMGWLTDVIEFFHKCGDFGNKF